MDLLPPPPRVLADARNAAPAHAVLDMAGAHAVAARLAACANSVVAGKPEVVDVTITALLSGGHVLVEDLPGVGKTLLAQVLSRALGGTFHRIQGTSDLLPGDVTGSMVPDASGRSMVFRPGPIFANVVVFDELNRVTPRTQSALLESTEEGTVSIDGISHRIPDPFILIATQNPLDIAGTYGLGEGSLDRFSVVVSPGRPSRAAELEVLVGRQGRSMLDGVQPVTNLDEVRTVRRLVGQVHVSDELAGYVVSILEATRIHPAVRVGASTRGGVSLISLARARALVRGRTYVVPDDVASLAVDALAHRIMPVDVDGSTGPGRRLVAECLATVAPPTA